MGKRPRVIRVIRTWCGSPPANGTDKLEDLWLQHGPSGVPFDDEGAERLISGLDGEFPGHGLRVVDVLGLTFDGLVNAIPNSVAAATASVATVAATRRGVAAPPAGLDSSRAPMPQGVVTVALTDETIERLATRIAELLRPLPRGRKTDPAAPSSRRTARSAAGKKSTPKAGGRKRR